MRLRLLLVAALVASLGFGCQKPVPTPAPGIVPPTPPASVSEAPPGWARYEDPSGFRFDYPEEQGAEVMTDDLYPESAIAIDLGPTVLPEGRPSVPNLRLSVLVLGSDDFRMHEGCFFDAGWSDRSGIPTSTFSVARQDSCVTEESDAGAGNRYHSRTYAIPHRGGFIVFRFTVHSVVCENYDNPERDCVAFDAARDFASVQEILKTVTVDPGPWLGQSVETHTLTKKLPHAEYAITYPSVEPENDLGLRSANELAQNAATTLAVGFEEDAKDVVEEDLGAAGPWTLDIAGGVPHLSSEVVSVVFRGSVYTGGAHPNAVYQTVLVDRKNGNELALADLFVDSKTGFETLAEKVRGKLKTQNELESFSDEDWIRTGTEPTEENYSFFGFTDEGLLVILPPYQVAAYAAGAFDVVIPWSELGGLLKPRFIRKP